MKHMSQKKQIIISVLVILVVVVGGLFAYLAINTASTPQAPSDNFANTPNYGACQLVTTEVIRTANQGDAISTISEGTRSAVDGLNGEPADACKFSFTTGKSANNSFTISVYPYNASREAFEKENKTANWTEVSGPKPTPYFAETTIDNGETSLYMLRVIPGANTILLSLKQPKNASAYDKANALNFLTDISTKINFGTLERKVVEQADSITEGDGPGTPPKQEVEQALPR